MDLEEFLVFKKEGLWMDWMIKSENYTGIIKLSFVKRMCYGTFF